MIRNKQTKKDQLAAEYARAAADGALRSEFMRQTDAASNNGSWTRGDTGEGGTWQNSMISEHEEKDTWKKETGVEVEEVVSEKEMDVRKTVREASQQTETVDEQTDDVQVQTDSAENVSEEMTGESKYGLVPSGNLIDEDDMRHLASIQEEFSQAMDPILRLYNAAMNVTATRMSIIKDEFKSCGKRNPIHHIDTRLKSSDSILHKLEKKGFELSINSMANNIYDIAGVRVICSYIKDVYLVRDRILDQDDLVIMEIKDYIENPKPNGYRSLHMIVRVPVYFMNKKQMVPVEIQIRTEAMDMWASLEHDIKYKSLYQDIGVDFTSELLEASQLIYKAEEKMEYMNDILEE